MDYNPILYYPFFWSPDTGQEPLIILLFLQKMKKMGTVPVSHHDYRRPLELNSIGKISNKCGLSGISCISRRRSIFVTFIYTFFYFFFDD